MTLVVNGRAVGEPMGSSTRRATVPIPTAADLSPAAVAVRRMRPVVGERPCPEARYLLYPVAGHRGDTITISGLGRSSPANPDRALRFPVRIPSGFPTWPTSGRHEYEIGPDRFFMLGDNSPCSKDSRGWGHTRIGTGTRPTARPGRCRGSS